MTPQLIGYITTFVLAAFVGIEVISKVPTILHTPLMSGSNAIHGIILVGAIAVTAASKGNRFGLHEQKADWEYL